MKNKVEHILKVLDEYFPNPKCELNYQKDYQFLIAVMLSSQTTDKRVNMVTEILFEKYSSLQELTNASLEDIKKIIRPIGVFNKKAQNILSISNYLIENCNGIVPNNRKVIEGLSGVGHKTANVVLSNLFSEPCIAVDTHVARVSKRLRIVKENFNINEIEKRLMKLIPKKRWSKTHHQLVLFGRYICTAIKPNCSTCKLIDICPYNKKNLN